MKMIDIHIETLQDETVHLFGERTASLTLKSEGGTQQHKKKHFKMCYYYTSNF